jgi:hypothetical protein
MTIVPDTKDWTWVLGTRCPDCGYEAENVAPEAVAGLLEGYAATWEDVLGLPAVRERPAPDVWSPLEYGCHIRDVCRIFDERLRLMLTQDNPLFPNWDQDETAIADRYGEQDPAVVTAELRAAAGTLAADFTSVRGVQWDRDCRRSDGAQFTIATFSRYFLHDIVHHLHDVGAG